MIRFLYAHAQQLGAAQIFEVLLPWQNSLIGGSSRAHASS